MRKHYFAGIASFLIVGMGQIINGESKKGLQMLLFFYLALPAAAYASLVINGYLFLIILGFCLIIGIALWLYSVWEALNYKE